MLKPDAPRAANRPLALRNALASPWWCVSLTVCCLCSPLLVGCGSQEEIGVIRGKVTYEGEPVTDATVFFRDHNRGIHIMAELDSAGNYQVFTAGGNGLPLGDYAVCLSPNAPGLSVDPNTGQIAATPQSRTRRTDIPVRYQDVKTSPLAVSVGPGENQFDIALVVP